MTSNIDMSTFDMNVAFNKARHKAARNKWISRVFGRKAGLKTEQEVLASSARRNQFDRGIQLVCVENITGTAGRSTDFDNCFMPLTEKSRGRWTRINSAHIAGQGLPPVELHKIGGDYFVQDGNHRVSVARFHDQLYIEAHVIEIAVYSSTHTSSTDYAHPQV